MSEGYVTPSSSDVISLLEMVFGEGVGASEGGDFDATGKHVATFLDDEDKLVAVCLSDLAFLIYSGAALSMVPADAAKEMLNDNEITAVVSANFYEVMNICSKLMMDDRSAHLRLAKTLTPEEGAEAVASLSGGASTVFELDIPRYGKGEISFLIA